MLKLKGLFNVEHIRDGKTLGKYEFNNGIVDVGANMILDAAFHNVAAIATWYIGLIDNAGFTALANADTMAAHAGWVELEDYTEATRPEWTEGAAATRSITNAVTVDFTIDDTKTVKGIFITSSNVKGGAAGTLWSTAAFTSVVNVVAADVLKITYTLSC